MEGNLSSGNMNIGVSSYLNQKHQSLFRQGSIVNHPIHENFPLTMGSCDLPISLLEFSKCERSKSSASEEDEPSFTEDTIDGHDDANKAKKGVSWHRVKWTDKMVRLLITAVSYIGDDANNENGHGSRRRCPNSQKKGKWKSISKVMAERGHLVSPQQCEDKFNDLNKRYKRLNEILGRGVSCEVVERPEILDMMHNLSEKSKDEVRKILSSKQLFYEEMCSYHNKNRLHLPHDPELQRSLRVALRNRDDHENNDLIEDDHDVELEDHEEYEENIAKKMKSCRGHGDFSMRNSLSFSEFNKKIISENVPADNNLSFSEGVKDKEMENQWLKHRELQLEEKSLQIQMQTLELEREKFKWERYCRKGDRELELMRAENEKMKLENERLILELKKKEMTIDKEYS